MQKNCRYSKLLTAIFFHMLSSVSQDTIPFLLRHDPNCVPDVCRITRVLFILFEYSSSIEIKSNNDYWVTFKSQRSASKNI